MLDSIENKKKYFAQYWDQEVFNNGLMGNIEPYYFTGINHDEICGHDFMILKDFSKLTPDHANEVAKSICKYFTFNDSTVIARDNNGNTNVVNGRYALKIGQKVDELNKGFVLIVDGIAQRMFAFEAILFYRKLVDLGYYVGDGREIEYGWVILA